MVPVRLLACIVVLLYIKVDASNYRYQSYATIVERLEQLGDDFPELIRVRSAQDEFGLPAVGSCDGANGNRGDCLIWFADVTNFNTLSEHPDRPQMLVSGEVHGDEIIGVQVAIEFIDLLVSGYGRDPNVTRLVDSRFITVLPMANAVGYANNTREEMHAKTGDSFDPNRDFPFNQRPELCMLTVAARAINELLLTHLYRLLITFHGGTNVIGYEWGDNGHCQGRKCEDAPDKEAMSVLAVRMRDYAGPAGVYEEVYEVGDMGSTVYPVSGGMEDWGYGASWAGDSTPCTPETLGGYPSDRTTYIDASTRCVTYLVETAMDKAPPEETLGTSADPLTTGGKGDGHVPRNLRLLLAAADALEPYAEFSDARIKGSSFHCRWFVGGSFYVLDTLVEYAYEGDSVRYRTPSQSGNGSFPIGDFVTEFSADIDIERTAGALFVRVLSLGTDSPLGEDIGSGRPESHFARGRTDPNWSYSMNGVKVGKKDRRKSRSLSTSGSRRRCRQQQVPQTCSKGMNRAYPLVKQVQGRDQHASGTKKVDIDSENVVDAAEDEIAWDTLTLSESEPGPEESAQPTESTESGEPSPTAGPGEGSEDGSRSWVTWAIIGGLLGVLLFVLFIFQAVRSSAYDMVSLEGSDPGRLDEDEEPLRPYP